FFPAPAPSRSKDKVLSFEIENRHSTPSVMELPASARAAAPRCDRKRCRVPQPQGKKPGNESLTMKPLLPEQRHRELERINSLNSIQKFGIRKKSAQIVFRKF